MLAALAAAAPLPKLKVSDNKRFLVTAAGEPFFYLADTAWELFHRLNRKEAVRVPGRCARPRDSPSFRPWRLPNSTALPIPMLMAIFR